MGSFFDGMLEIMYEEAVEKVREEITEQLTEQVTAQLTEQVTAQVTEQLTQQMTAQVTAQVTEELNEKFKAATFRSICNLRTKLQMTAEQAMDMLEVPEEERAQYRELLRTQPSGIF